MGIAIPGPLDLKRRFRAHPINTHGVPGGDRQLFRGRTAARRVGYIAARDKRDICPPGHGVPEHAEGHHHELDRDSRRYRRDPGWHARR